MEQTNSTMTQPDAMISLRNLRVSYGEREILHGINFDVMRGETLVILGGSGSGKSTLLRTLVGLERPSSGEIWLKGKNIAAISSDEMDEIRKKIGMSFQGGALFGSMTVGENVALPLREHTKLEDSTIEIILRLKLDQVGLSGFENYMPAQLSGAVLVQLGGAGIGFSQSTHFYITSQSSHFIPNGGNELLGCIPNQLRGCNEIARFSKRLLFKGLFGP